MYLSKEVILYAFGGLKKIFPKDGGKSRQERVSALRTYLAAVRIIHETGNDTINLRADSDQRKVLTENVGEVVRLDGTGWYTQDFASRVRKEADYMVGSNFLTTGVAQSRSTTKSYPGRPKSIISLQNEVLSLVDDAEDILLSDFNIDSIKPELLIWLARFEDLTVSESSALDEVAKAVTSKVETLYGQRVASLLAIGTTDFSEYLGACPTPLLSALAPDLSVVWQTPTTSSVNTLSQATVPALNASDPYLTEVQDALNRKGETNFLFFGAPGTGKTWYASQIADHLTAGASERVKFLQFHPSVSYDDFVEGFVPRIDPTTQGVTYEIQKKHFIEFANAAVADEDNVYVLIIDEISRGDPARVFGELLTYIEPNYRSKEFSLIYSGDTFFVPENLIILATANPYDRSVGELDDAFLRRFYMLEFEPSSELLRERLRDSNVPDADGQRVVHFFEIIHQNLPHGFGHAQLFNVLRIEDIKSLWRSKLRFLIKRSLQFEPEKFELIQNKYVELFEGASESSETTSAPPAAVASTDK